MGDDCVQKTPKRSKPRKGTSNKGQEYEILLPALFTLFFLEDDTIKNFVLRSNVQKFGSLDDLLINLYKTHDQEENYAFQLKHKEKQNLILSPKCLESEAKNDFSVLKYCEEFPGIAEREKYVFIIYTNAYFRLEHLSEVCNFDVECNGRCPGSKYFYRPSTNEDQCNAKIYNFRANDNTKITNLATADTYERFFEKFAIYTCQQNWREVQETVIENFQRIFGTSDRSAAMSYIDIFKYWKLHEYTKVEISKEELQIKILDLILTPHVIAPSAQNSLLMDKAFAKFDFALVSGLSDAEVATMVAQPVFEKNDNIVRLAKDMKFLTKNVTKFSNRKHEMEVKQKIGYYRKETPIVVKMHDRNLEAIVTTVTKLRNHLHFVLTGDVQVVREKLSNYRIFETLFDLMVHGEIYEHVIKQMKISLFGREYLYSEFFANDEMAKKVTIKDMFRMMSGLQLTVNTEVLSVPYVHRFLSKTLVKIESIDEIRHDLLVINLKKNSKIAELLQKRLSKPFVTMHEYLKPTLLTNCVICQEELSSSDFDKISERTGTNAHFFAVQDEEFLQWISTKGSIKQVKNCELSREMYLDESTTFEQSHNLINVVVASAGMGKSELLKKFKNSCPSNFFPILIHLKEHGDFFKNVHENNAIVEHFLFDSRDDFFLSEVKKNFARRRQTLFFFDGLDELQHQDIDVALDQIKRLFDMGFTIWLSSRSYLEERIENRLNVFAMKIKPFSEQNQKDYIRERLTPNPNVEELVDEVFKNVDTIVDNRDILDIPLQLFMITEILRESSEITDNIFVLTKMFRQFFVGRYQHFLRKSGHGDWKPIQKIIDDSVKYRMRQYQIAALKSYFRGFNLDLDKSFVDEITTEGDFLGIILKMNPSTVVFHHNVTATYLVALFFSENYSNYRRFLQDTIFEHEHFYLRVLFDLLLAEESPAHVAVLCRNVEALRKCESHTVIDNGGRSTLHLACSYGSTHPIMTNSVKNENIDHFIKLRKDDEQSRQIIEELLNHQTDLFAKDLVYQWNCLDFSDKTLSILPLDIILERTNIVNDKIQSLRMLKDRSIDVLICCAIFSYRHLFDIMFEPSQLKPETITDILHTAAWFNNWKIVNIMMEHKVDIQTATKRGKTILHQVCAMGHLELVMLLLLKEADVNSVDQFGRTPLHLAAANGQVRTVKTLLKHGAYLDCVDKYGRTPLYLAVDKGKDDLVKYLVDEAYALLHRTAWNGWGPFHIAIIQGHTNIVKFLADKVNVDVVDGYGTKALHLAAKQPNVDILDMVLKKSRSVDVVTNDGRTSLHLAAEIGNVASCEFLLQNKANIDARDDLGRSVLHWAVIMGQLDVVDLLLKKNVNVELVDNIGNSCLHWGAELGHFRIVELLVNKTTKLINVQAKNRSTALHWAANNGHDNIVELLVEKGADVNLKDNQERTPLCWAALEGRSQTVEFLLDQKALHVSISGMLALDFAKKRRTI